MILFFAPCLPYPTPGTCTLECAWISVGDRIVSVNGRTIFGISYDTVVHLIQKSPHTLGLTVSPKQYDTLQLVRYSKLPCIVCKLLFRLIAFYTFALI